MSSAESLAPARPRAIALRSVGPASIALVLIGATASVASASTFSPPVLLAWLLIVVSGLASGFLAGLLGIGGALVTVPTLYAVLPMFGTAADQLPRAVIVGALIAMVPTALMGAYRQRRYGALDVDWLKRLAPSMAVGAGAGAALSSQVQGTWLGWAFAAQALYYGSRLVFDRRDDGSAAPRGLTRRICHVPVVIAGAGLSAFCASVGMGCASMIVPFLRHRGLELRSAVATAGTLNLCVALGGGATLVFTAASGRAVVDVPWQVALTLGLAAVVAVPLGVRLAHALPATRLRAMIGGINLVAAAVLAVQLTIGR